MPNDQEGKQPFKRHRRNDAQIDRGNRMGVIAQKRLPALGRRPLAALYSLFPATTGTNDDVV
jgi:hypothetical protein